MDDFIGQMNAGQKPVGLRGKYLITVDWGYVCGTLMAVFDVVSHGIDDQSAGHFTGQMTSHAIGNDIKPEGILEEQ